MSQPLHLYRLQQVDSDLDAAKKRIDEIDIALVDNTALNAAEDQHNQAVASQEKTQKELKRAEEDVSTQQQKIDNNQKTLYSGTVTNSKELEDLQNEAAALGRYLNKLEEIQLEKMIAFEDSQAHTEEKNEILEKAKSKKIQDTALLKGERSKLVEQSEKLDSNKLTVLEDVEPDNLRMYNKLRDKKRGRAVAEVKNDICSACGSTLTAAQAQEARSPITITCCNSCGRVLYSV
ncbi:MAG: hypothetical protein HON98_03565 [Chloroflexi bacterium]|mgnify:CR=1 FL=1|jgi:uncharacterized protein|nr:hypothetical protein [Chloroflexota bacterium]MBT3670437.1 hypothetical protein [Chloroflexota bacterium]MBT4004192.1 hypothetical protein [Chloroflexota bacterium]MBT4304661.1 hypothetical protein [Chloroflexota bacterium]MBT4534230.1 hypothetical protein [Chloroflexota bacterium]